MSNLTIAWICLVAALWLLGKLCEFIFGEDNEY